MAHAGTAVRPPGGGYRGAAEGLAGLGRVRIPGLVPEALCAALREAEVDWRPDGAAGMELADAPAGLLGAVRRALAEAGLEAPQDLRLMRHRPGGHGLPEGALLVIDLNDGWRSEDGGLLLFPEGEDRTVGWRPEAGTVTLFDPDAAPVLSLVAPCAPEPRLALVGLAG